MLSPTPYPGLDPDRVERGWNQFNVMTGASAVEYTTNSRKMHVPRLSVILIQDPGTCR